MNLRVESLSNKNWQSFENLFSDCEQCRKCWCLNHRVHPEEVVTGESAKEKMKDLVAQNKVGGLLGFVGDECVAWLSVDPLSAQPGHDYVLAEKSFGKTHWAIHCLYVSSSFRRKGFSKMMIEKALEFAKSRGASCIFAFPIPEGEQEKFPKDEAEFSGRYSTYKKIGFSEKERLDNFYQVMSLKI